MQLTKKANKINILKVALAFIMIVFALGLTTTAYAKTKTYTLTINCNGGKTTSGKTTASKKVTYGAKVGSLATPIKSKCVFLGWYTAKTGGTKITATTVYKYKKNITVYAHWRKAGTYSLTLNTTNGKFYSGATTYTKKVTESAKVGTLPTPTRKGFKFLGWYTTKSGSGKKITATTAYSYKKNLTLYARWSAIKYTITYNLGQNMSIYDIDSNPNPTTFCITSSTITLKAPKCTYYRFDGWYTSAKYTTKVTKIAKGTAKNITLYAKWTDLVEEAAQKFKSTYIKSGMTEFEKEMAIIGYLVENTDYDWANYKSGSIPAASYTAYGALVNHVAVCQGYALAFKKLCDICGLEAIVVTGTGNGGSHAWNQVKIGGSWYNVDVTWEDPIDGGTDAPNTYFNSKNLWNKYINLTNEAIEADHTFGENTKAYKCTATTYGPTAVASYLQSIRDFEEPNRLYDAA